jgi:hypothetical protein
VLIGYSPEVGASAGSFGKEASTRWAGGVDLSVMPGAGALDPADETSRDYERVIDPKYLDQIRTQAKEFSNKSLTSIGSCEVRNHELQEGKEHDQAPHFAKADKAIHDLQNKESQVNESNCG